MKCPVCGQEFKMEMMDMLIHGISMHRDDIIASLTAIKYQKESENNGQDAGRETT